MEVKEGVNILLQKGLSLECKMIGRGMRQGKEEKIKEIRNQERVNC